MKEPKTHYLVDFASRYAGVRFKTLNAASALHRAEALIDDVNSLLDLRKRGDEKDIWFGARTSTYEIISYFSVAFVTCLEWHARSRLVDLMLYRPSCIETSDVKNIATLALSQMVAEGVTVPHLLGAATKVSQVGDYVGILKRVFDKLGIRANLESEMRKTKSGVEVLRNDSLYAAIEELFEYRHQLVHEIGLAVIGHYSIRDMWTLEYSLNYGNAVVSCIKLAEAHITQHAPHDFPNRLHSDGYEEDEFEKLGERIAALEAEISDLLKEPDGIDSPWLISLRASQASRELELKYLEQEQALRPIRHLDVTRDFQIELLKSRLAFLLLLKSELAG